MKPLPKGPTATTVRLVGRVCIFTVYYLGMQGTRGKTKTVSTPFLLLSDGMMIKIIATAAQSLVSDSRSGEPARKGRSI